MAQTYTPVGWKDSPSTDTPINSTNLKHMDDAIKDLYEGAATTNEIIISDTQPTSEDNKLWIDTGEIGSQVSEITNEYSTSTGLGYSANYVNNLHTYSETEHRVGTWIDNKPIYQKTVILENVNISSGSLVNHDIANVDFIVGWNMIYKTPALPNNTYQNISYFRSTYSFGIRKVSTTDIQFDTQTDTGNINGMTLYFTMLYTKTTD